MSAKVGAYFFLTSCGTGGTTNKQWEHSEQHLVEQWLEWVQGRGLAGGSWAQRVGMSFPAAARAGVSSVEKAGAALHAFVFSCRLPQGSPPPPMPTLLLLPPRLYNKSVQVTTVKVFVTIQKLGRSAAGHSTGCIEMFIILNSVLCQH